MSKIVSAREALIAFAEGKSIRELPNGPWKQLGRDGDTVEYESGQWREVLEMGLTHQFEVNENLPVKVGQKIRFRTSGNVYVVRYVDTNWMFATSEDQTKAWNDWLCDIRDQVSRGELEVLP